MFEFFFKYPASAFHRGTLVLMGGWPIAFLFALLATAAALLAWTIIRRRGRRRFSKRATALWGLQSSLVGLLLLLLWEPALSITALKPQQNIVAVLLDGSRSMSLGETGGTRLAQAQQILGSGLLRNLASRFQIRLYRIGSTLERAADANQVKADASSSQIDRALKDLAAEAGTLPLGAAVVISDGADTSGGIDRETMHALQSRHLPVSTVGIGNTRLEQDVELDRFDLPARALADARLEAQFKIRQQGFDGRRARISVTMGSKTVATREITLRGGPTQTEPLEFQGGGAGIRAVEGRIDLLAGERNESNNRRTSIVSVEPRKRRILYLEGEPRWEYKFIRRALDEDTAVTIVSMLRTTPSKIYRQGIANPNELVDGFPTKAEALFAYDAIILGSVEAGFLTAGQQSLIETFVDRRGGGLLFLGGRFGLADGGYASSALAPLLPVTLPSRARTFSRSFVAAELTDAGKSSLICRLEDSAEKSNDHWEVLPYLADFEDAGVPKPGAVVLARLNSAGTRLPLLVTQNYGRGRTAVLASGGTWRWRMQQPLADKSQETFWRQLLRWTVTGTPGPVTGTVIPATAAASNTAADGGSATLQDDGHVRFTADVRDSAYLPSSDAEVSARIVMPDGASENVPMHPDGSTPGKFTADWNAPLPGSYAVELTALRPGGGLAVDTVPFRREDGVAENFRREQNRDLLERLALDTGGHYYAGQAASQLPREIAFSDAGITGRELRPIWDMPAVFLALLLLKGSEWLLRRRWGLV